MIKKILFLVFLCVCVFFFQISQWYDLTPADKVIISLIEQKINEKPSMKSMLLKVFKKIIIKEDTSIRIKTILLEVTTNINNLKSSEANIKDKASTIPNTPSRSWNVIETITCFFNNNTLLEQQECRSEAQMGNETVFFGWCHGKKECSVNVEWKLWYSLVWKSSCSNTPITTIDGTNQEIVFDCGEEKYWSYDWIFKIMTQNYGSYIWWGKNRDFSDKNWSKIRSISAENNAFRISVESFEISYIDFVFSSEKGENIEPWLYYPAKRNSTRWSYNGIDVWWNGRWCNKVLGGFYVHEYESDTMWEPQHVAIDFVFYCEQNKSTPIFGSIRYQSTIALWCNQNWCQKIHTLFQ